MINNYELLDDIDRKYGMDFTEFDFNPDIDVEKGDVIVQYFIDGSESEQKLMCVGKNRFRLLTNECNRFITGYRLLVHPWKIV